MADGGRVSDTRNIFTNRRRTLLSSAWAVTAELGCLCVCAEVVSLLMGFPLKGAQGLVVALSLFGLKRYMKG